jgi:hypothetical protein
MRALPRETPKESDKGLDSRQSGRTYPVIAQSKSPENLLLKLLECDPAFDPAFLRGSSK